MQSAKMNSEAHNINVFEGFQLLFVKSVDLIPHSFSVGLTTLPRKRMLSEGLWRIRSIKG